MSDDLLHRAVRVGRVPKTNRGRYWWVSRDEVVLLKPAARNSKLFSLHRLNTSTGKELPIDAFNSKHSGRIIGVKWHLSTHGVPGYKIAYWTPDCELSPNGEWFVWLSDRFSDRPMWIAASLDGTMEREWEEEHDIPSSCLWLRDSKRLVQLVRQYKRQRYKFVEAIVRPIVGRSSKKTIPTEVADGRLLGLTGRTSILLDQSRSKRVGSKLTLCDFSLTPGELARRYSIKIPGFLHLHELALSQHGDRLVLILSTVQQSYPKDYFFCVSGLDGERIKAVGRMEGRFRSNRRKYLSPTSLQWLPDGDEISFVFNDELYRLRVS